MLEENTANKQTFTNKILIFVSRQSGQNKEGRPDLEETPPTRTSRNAEKTHTYGNISGNNHKHL